LFKAYSVTPVTTFRWLFMHLSPQTLRLALSSAGTKMPSKSEVMNSTTKSSIRVNPHAPLYLKTDFFFSG
jgi:hypothetical protein